MYKNPQGSFLETSIFDDFWRFFELYDPFQSFPSGSGGVLRGLQKRQEMTKNAIFS